MPRMLQKPDRSVLVIVAGHWLSVLGTGLVTTSVICWLLALPANVSGRGAYGIGPVLRAELPRDEARVYCLPECDPFKGPLRGLPRRARRFRLAPEQAGRNAPAGGCHVRQLSAADRIGYRDE